MFTLYSQRVQIKEIRIVRKCAIVLTLCIASVPCIGSYTVQISRYKLLHNDKNYYITFENKEQGITVQKFYTWISLGGVLLLIYLMTIGTFNLTHKKLG